MIEMLTTISLLAVVSAITVPALQGVNSANSLSVAAREFSNLLSQARSEAIARHNVVRVAVETYNETSNVALRRASLWEWNEEEQKFVQFTPWQNLTEGLVFENSAPEYIRNAAYAQADGSSIRGDFVLDPYSSLAASFNPDDIPGKTRVIEFLPSGSARVPGAHGRNVIYVIAPGFANGSGDIFRNENEVHNWAQINVDTLTGRVRIYRP